MDLHTNSSNNTIFADADGDHRVLPRELHPEARPAFDWTKPVDGSNPATEWGEAACRVDESPLVHNPAERLALQHEQLAVLGGRARTARSRQRISRTTWTRAARTRAAFTRIRWCWTGRRTSRSTRCIAAAYDSYLTAFDRSSRRCSPPTTSCRRAVRSRRSWPSRSRAARLGLPLVGDVRSPTSLAVFWGEELWRACARGCGVSEAGCRSTDYMAKRRRRRAQLLEALSAAVRHADRGLRHVEDAVGRHQPLPASDRRHRAAVQRRGPEHSGGLHVGALGLARVVRRARRTRARRNGTARAATASSRSWSSATA